MFLRSWLIVASLISVFFMVGCNGGDSSGPVEGLVPVSGTLLVDDKPLDDVVVNFIPLITKESTSKLGGSGTTDATGAFSITYLGQDQPGLLPGKYSVSYSRMRLSDGTAAPKLKEGEAENPSNIPIETMPVHLQAPDATLEENQVEIPQNGNTKLELKVKTK